MLTMCQHLMVLQVSRDVADEDVFLEFADGLTIAERQSAGTSPRVTNLWKIIVRIGTRSAAKSFKMRAGTISGPDALCRFIFFSSFRIPSLLISIWHCQIRLPLWMWNVCLILLGYIVDSSLVNVRNIIIAFQNCVFLMHIYSLVGTFL